MSGTPHAIDEGDWRPHPGSSQDSAGLDETPHASAQERRSPFDFDRFAIFAPGRAFDAWAAPLIGSPGAAHEVQDDRLSCVAI